MSADSVFNAFGRSKYLNLESFRKTGQGVRTPVWFAGEPPSGTPQKLYVYSEAGSGKAKRIRRDSRVRIAPCNVRGKLLGDWIEARAEIVEGEEAARGIRLLNAKYSPWKQILDFFAKFGRRGHVLFSIRPADSAEIGRAGPLVCSGWQIAGIRSAAEFFSALPELLPLPATLCFEGTKIASDVQALFASNAIAPSLQIPPGTIWPKPGVFHVAGTEQFLLQLVALAGKHAEGEVCDHFHAYKGDRGMLQWYDAFSGDPVLVAESISEGAVQRFCRKLRAQYAPWRAQ